MAHHVTCMGYSVVFRNHVLRQGYDLVTRPVLQDLTGTLGFLQAISLMLRVEQGGLAALAIPCNSFGYMSSSQHSRSWFNPLGDPRFPFVQTGNIISLRAMMLIALAVIRCVYYFVENPERSSIAVHPWFVFMMSNPRLFGMRRTFWWGKHKVVKCFNNWSTSIVSRF